MLYSPHGSVAVIWVFSAWLSLGPICDSNCHAQQDEAEQPSEDLEELYGSDVDAPPPGAVVHIHDSDFWHPEMVHWVAFSPDSQTLLTFIGETLFRWRVPAVAKLREVVRPQENEKIIADEGDYGDCEPLYIVGLPTHERVVFLVVEHPSHIAGGRLADRYRVVVRSDGTVDDITHTRSQTCLATGSLVETGHGPRPVEQLRPGIESGRLTWHRSGDC